jgi:hypothetical protein
MEILQPKIKDFKEIKVNEVNLRLNLQLFQTEKYGKREFIQIIKQ